MDKGVGKATSMKGRDSITVKSPKVIITYQQHMGGFYRGDQHRVMRVGFTNVAHFKKTGNNLWGFLVLVPCMD